ncbi:MAG TPA: hypothetical protein VKM55_22150 [Candidatus Lokiarchaeia archaeon]|nr:hypothetical protein [Candidatus Lokiarchaeia archaeon]
MEAPTNFSDSLDESIDELIARRAINPEMKPSYRGARLSRKDFKLLRRLAK